MGVSGREGNKQEREWVSPVAPACTRIPSAFSFLNLISLGSAQQNGWCRPKETNWDSRELPWFKGAKVSLPWGNPCDCHSSLGCSTSPLAQLHQQGRVQFGLASKCYLLYTWMNTTLHMLIGHHSDPTTPYRNMHKPPNYKKIRKSAGKKTQRQTRKPSNRNLFFPYA